MAASVEQLKKALAELDRQVTEQESQLKQLYQSYVSALQQALQRQLILACYHICTEGNPDGFLRLSVSDRTTLQNSLRQLAQDGQKRLEALLYPNPSASEPAIVLPNLTLPSQPSPQLNPTTTLPSHLAAKLAAANFLPIHSDQAADGDSAEDTEALEDIDLGDADLGDAVSEELGEHWTEDDLTDRPSLLNSPFNSPQDPPPSFQHQRLSSPTEDRHGENSEELVGQEVGSHELEALLAKVAAMMSSRQPCTPVDQILQWQEEMERSLRQTLRHLSHRTNQTLQKANILDAKLPDQVLEAAAKAEGTEATSKVPNVIQMLVEAMPPGPAPGPRPEPSPRRGHRP
ncbi:MAG: hypothetical protein VKJ24_05535, partial [Synechococcales bacterium]|nr:hypothetical protein [Synechococcales bacterium]